MEILIVAMPALCAWFIAVLEALSDESFECSRKSEAERNGETPKETFMIVKKCGDKPSLILKEDYTFSPITEGSFPLLFDDEDEADDTMYLLGLENDDNCSYAGVKEQSLTKIRNLFVPDACGKGEKQ